MKKYPLIISIIFVFFSLVGTTKAFTVLDTGYSSTSIVCGGGQYNETRVASADATPQDLVWPFTGIEIFGYVTNCSSDGYFARVAYYQFGHPTDYSTDVWLITGYGSSAVWMKFHGDNMVAGWNIVDTSTRIISLTPSSNTTIIPFVSTSTDRSADFDVDILEYYNSSATDTAIILSTNLKNNNVINFNYSTSTFNIISGSSTSTSYTVAKNVPFGNYNLTVSLLGSNLEVIDSTTSSNITFGSSTNAITFADIYGASSSNPYDISQIATSSECGITNISGCFKNAIVWAFYPSEEAMDAYYSFVTTIQEKAPVGYFYLIKNSISGISTSSTPVFNITIPAHIKQYFFTPLDIGIASILWIYFIFMFYKRLKQIQL